jgi:hypothetical protein
MVLTGIREQVTSNQLPVASCQLPVASCRLPGNTVPGYRFQEPPAYVQTYRSLQVYKAIVLSEGRALSLATCTR